MAEFQALARILTSAGGAFGLSGEGLYLLDTEDGNLSLKHHTGEQWGDQEILADDARPSSSAAFILTPLTKLIFYINNDSMLRALKYDADDEEWVNEESLPEIEVHAEGQLAASAVTVESCDIVHIFYQDPDGTIVALDGTWNSLILPVEPLIGTPINVNDTEKYLDVAYISSKENTLHVLSREGEGEWSDDVVATEGFTDAVKRLVCIRNVESGWRDTYALTTEGTVVHVDARGNVEGVGKVDEDGKYVPQSSAQNVSVIGILKKIFGGMTIVIKF